MKLIKTVLLISAFAVAAIANAQTCNEKVIASTPDSRFTDNGDGTVTDKSTNLIWMRCALGRNWNGSTCTGIAVEYTWQGALDEADGYTFVGSSAWRLPSLKQLASIVEHACYDPAINLKIFPQTPSGEFWTASHRGVFNSGDVPHVNFVSGYDSSSGKSGSLYVRLVRSGATDGDGDGIADEVDNCPSHANADQLNTDGDAQGNACDADDDNDGILDVDDDNPLVADTDAVTVTIDGIAQIEHGTITPTEPRVVHQGKPLEFTVIADAGYYPHISGCNGSLVGTTFTIPSVDGDCDITLSFKPPTAPLNDTGITRCGNADDNDLDCAQAGFPGQDAEFGRDVTHNDDSDGHAGFSFSKICNSGEAAGEGNCPADPVLGSGANEWACTRDNVTSLIWEVKTDDGGLRDKDNTYSWYNLDSNTNGGVAGTENGGTCPDAGNCDTEKYVASVNAVGICGYSDWRMPNFSELRSIVNSSRSNPAIDVTYFPNAGSYWTDSTQAYYNNGYNAWRLSFYYGDNAYTSKNVGQSVRLVRLYSE